MRARRDDETPSDRSAPRGALAYGTTRFALFGEVLLVGVVVAVLSLPVVTVVPVLAVAVRHLRRHLVGEPDSVGRMLRDLPAAMRDQWPLGLATPAALAVLAYNVWFAMSGARPGGPGSGVVSAVVAIAVGVVVLRVVGAWIPGQHLWRSVRAAARCARFDLGGSALLVAAVVMCGALVWMLAPLVLAVGGLLALAVLAVEHRLGQGPHGGVGRTE